MALLARDALVSIAQRRAAALNYRLQGHNYAAIGKHLGVTANAVQKDVVKALRDFIKPKTAHAVLAMELTRLDAMQAAVYAEAINGDTGAIDTCLKIMNQRQRLLNLVPDHKPPVFNLSFGGGTDMPNAEEVGIRVEFIRPSPGHDREGAAAEAHKIINGKLLEGDPQGITYSPSLVVKS